MTTKNTSIRIPTETLRKLKLAAAICVIREYYSANPMEFSVNQVIVSGLCSHVGIEPPKIPTRKSNGEMTTLLVSMPDDLFDEVSRRSAEDGMTRNKLYKLALNKYLKTEFGEDIAKLISKTNQPQGYAVRPAGIAVEDFSIAGATIISPEEAEVYRPEFLVPVFTQ